MRFCDVGKFKAYVAIHSYSTMWYVLRRREPEDEVRRCLADICQMTNVAGITKTQMLSAIRNDAIRDFEDCIQDECAVSVEADYIVTCNVKDYTNSKVKALTPREMLDVLEGKNEV